MATGGSPIGAYQADEQAGLRRVQPPSTALPHIRAVWQPYVTRAKEQLGHAAWVASCDAGVHLTVADAVTQAMTACD